LDNDLAGQRLKEVSTMIADMLSAEKLMGKIQSLSTERIAEVEDFVDFLKNRTKRRKSSAAGRETLDFPVDDLGAWPNGLSLRRMDVYGDDGR
jgi:hypothetical protein